MESCAQGEARDAVLVVLAVLAVLAVLVVLHGSEAGEVVWDSTVKCRVL